MSCYDSGLNFVFLGADTAMHRHALTLLVVAGLLMGAARDGAAQTDDWTDRGYININAGFQAASVDLNDTRIFSRYGEDARLEVDGGVESGALFDLSGGVRVWRNVSVGVGYHGGSSTSGVRLEASIPHPIFFGQSRTAIVDVSDLERTEKAYHLQFGYMIPVNDKLDVHVSIGPSRFTLSQDVVSDVTITEQGVPFTTVGVTPTITERKDTAFGYNIGADVTYMLYERDEVRVGAGLFMRYSGASAEILMLSNTISSDVGGLQAGFGARVRF